MAEAHQAVGFSFQITHEGIDVNFDREVLKLVWSSGLRSWKKRMGRFKNSVKAGVYPAPLSSWLLTFAINFALFLLGIDIWGLTKYFSRYFSDGHLLLGYVRYQDVMGCAVSSTTSWPV